MKAHATLLLPIALATAQCGFLAPSPRPSAECPAPWVPPAAEGPPCEVHADLTWAASMNPTESVREAAYRQDFRALGVYGYALYTPGLPDRTGCWRETLGVRAIEGTEAAFECPLQAQLQARAEVNACLYNRALLRHLLAHGADPRVRRLTRRCS
jgi:hypothetical protein